LRILPNGFNSHYTKAIEITIQVAMMPIDENVIDEAVEVGSRIGEGTGTVSGSAMGSAIGSATGSATGSAMGSAKGAALGLRVKLRPFHWITLHGTELRIDEKQAGFPSTQLRLLTQ
jgi:outer membrane lipoprotein SlyB